MKDSYRRSVLDTSVLVPALRSRRGASNRILQLAFMGKLRFPATPALFLEYEDVLTRPEQIIGHGHSPAQVEVFLTDLAAVIQPVEVYYQWRPQLVDPDDELVLEAAINAGVDTLVTYNLKHFRSAANRFGIRALTPAALLKEVDP